ncbi:MAG: DnaJ domain-containing protein [Aphanocapsa sp. GSE-SYN-MK-11-07L]|jgi:molecular chaperone DnaJ|nr:DnaJ domain-containing protein [Aphanocapsa sp. GSE-SYN-MK-11-07L]
MPVANHYQTLGIDPRATQAEIKQAYRRLAKRFHPDRSPQEQDHRDRMARINAAYEVLGDVQHRQRYDLQQQATLRTPAYVGQRARRGQSTDEHLQAWLQWVYGPVNDWVESILEPLPDQLDQLADDPFDDELIEAFQAYLNDCRQSLTEAQRCFRSMPNPANLAGVAASLYHCLNQLADGIDQLEFFTLNYDDTYLHTGQELFRIARGLSWEAEVAMSRF